MKHYTFSRKEDHDIKMKIHRSRVHQSPLGKENIKQIKEEREKMFPLVTVQVWQGEPGNMIHNVNASSIMHLFLHAPNNFDI